jgi:hypothetical protein
MCGLVGMLGDIGEPEKKMFRDMLIFNQVRGFDSTGVAAVFTSVKKDIEEVKVEKDVGAAQNLWEYADAATTMFNPRGIITGFVKVLIGHNRATTVGETNVDNAHPFNYGSIFGAHNGTLTWTKDLIDDDTFDVDSKSLFNHIAQKGVEDAWKSFYGAAALTFFDKEKDITYLIRNSQRPLFIVESEDGKCMFWASESWMIDIAAQRCKVKLNRDEKTKKMIVRPLKENTLYSFKTGGFSFEELEERELEKKKYVTPTYHRGNVTVFNKKRTFGTSNFGFTYIHNWKDNSIRGDIHQRDIALFDFRRAIKWHGAKFLKEADIFKATMCKANDVSKVIGQLEIVPTNQKEFDRLSSWYSLNYLVKLTAKPRLLAKFQVGSKYICSAGVIEKIEGTSIKTEVFYNGAHNTSVTKQVLEKQLANVGSTCSGCDKVFDENDYDTIEWSGADPLCGSCMKDFSISNFIGMIP